MNYTLLSGCIAAAGAVYAEEGGVPPKWMVLDYALELYDAALLQIKKRTADEAQPRSVVSQQHTPSSPASPGGE